MRGADDHTVAWLARQAVRKQGRLLRRTARTRRSLRATEPCSVHPRRRARCPQRERPLLPARVKSAMRAASFASPASETPDASVHVVPGHTSLEAFHFEMARNPKYVPTPRAAIPSAPTPMPTGRTIEPCPARAGAGATGAGVDATASARGDNFDGLLLALRQVSRGPVLAAARSRRHDDDVPRIDRERHAPGALVAGKPVGRYPQPLDARGGRDRDRQLRHAWLDRTRGARAPGAPAPRASPARPCPPC